MLKQTRTLSLSNPLVHTMSCYSEPNHDIQQEIIYKTVEEEARQMKEKLKVTSQIAIQKLTSTICHP